MDASTLRAYDRNAAGYCDDWLNQPAPADIHALWRRFFTPGGASADIGCGSGRDVDWLNRNGYPCVGFEPSQGLRNEARRLFPDWRYEAGALPDLDALGTRTFANVVCETVLMHLPLAQIRPAVRALARTLGSGGTLYLSWRVTDGCNLRDSAGRLYCAFPVDVVRDELACLAILYDANEVSESSARRVHRLIAQRPG
jgi:SAM-dependent methyltransferase